MKSALCAFVFILISLMPLHAADLQHVHVQMGANGEEFQLEFARTEAQRNLGLMYRATLPERGGMLFDFAQTNMTEQLVYMWMHNTPLSLDMVFVRENGVIAKIIERTTPMSDKILSSEVPVRFVIEVEAGRVHEVGWAVGKCLHFHSELSNLANMCQ